MPALTTPTMLTFVGDVGVGKTWQFVKIFGVQDEDGTHPFRPCLFITSDGAARGTGAPIINSPQAAHYEATTPERLTEILEQVFPYGHNGEPFALVIFDGWSTLQEQTKQDVQSAAHAEDKTFDNRVLAAKTAPRMRTAAAAWQNASASEQGKGCVFVSTCHVVEEWRQRPGSKDINDRLRMGLKMDVSGSVFTAVHRNANAVVYFMSVLPDISDSFTGETMEEFDANLDALNEATINGEPGAAPVYCAITRPRKYMGDELAFIKHQDNLFDNKLVKVGWRSPDFGEALRTSPLRKQK